MQIKTKKNKKQETKRSMTMFAAVHACYDREDLERSTVEIIGVYPTEKAAEQAKTAHYKNFLSYVDDEDEEHAKQMLDDYDDYHYEWFVQAVEVEV